jgi:hypothetical protein
MCHEWKPEADFAFRSIATGKRQDHCRKCHAAYRRQHYLKNREQYIAREVARITSYRIENRLLVYSYLQSHPCVDCGETDVVVLEFDHRDPATKRRDVAYLAARKSWKTVLVEIAKCDVRCANCHRRRTAAQFSWVKTGTPMASARVETPPLSGEIVLFPSERVLLKRCSRCHEEKEIGEFALKNRRTGLRATICRACTREYGRKHYRENKARYLQRGKKNKRRYRIQNRTRVATYLTEHHCVDCGESDIMVLEFDHRDGRDKEDEVARLIGTGEWAKLAAEIAKCDVRCANCHRRKTARQLGWSRAMLQAGSKAEVDLVGTRE